MIERLFDGALLEKMLNQALSLDSELAEKLAPLEGKTISIRLNLRERPWYLQVSGGRFYLLDEATADQADVRLSGSLSGFLRLFRSNAQAQGVNDKLYIEGDLHSAQQFQRVMAQISPDFDALFKQRFGDRLGSLIADGMHELRQQGDKARDVLEQKLADYLHHETDGVLTRTDALAHQHRISELRRRLDRLEARVKQLGQA
ncbi:SCP2 sterol-binding domain-containing protein [Suttonella sp. R2A3]|uniref:ubiquinone biosynthesis accessory factor UbiJ n=1 Tax=Suttonella sp. R2A3 TaxID=2908648 RepID=UPI001F17D59F|nr:SCP2 sterol-binding domain-containing protein [Suttonella sp. R2A3]UJF24853.1 SCP2 sterol-binding domain-containing protein [Suttonella sp. R2A3]